MKFKTYAERLREIGVEVFQGKEYNSGDFKLEPDKWYWWSCTPGCLPEGDPIGPFDSYNKAAYDALPEPCPLHTDS